MTDTDIDKVVSIVSDKSSRWFVKVKATGEYLGNDFDTQQQARAWVREVLREGRTRF